MMFICSNPLSPQIVIGESGQRFSPAALHTVRSIGGGCCLSLSANENAIATAQASGCHEPMSGEELVRG